MSSQNVEEWFKPAPPGGKVFAIPWLGFEIWVPEGWKMADEPDPSNPKKGKPIWYRESNPHGALRVSALAPKKGLFSRKFDPVAEARSMHEKQKGQLVENLSVENRPGRTILSWDQVIQEPRRVGPTKTHIRSMYDENGIVLLTFSCDPKIDQAELQQELANVKEIANRIIHL